MLPFFPFLDSNAAWFANNLFTAGTETTSTALKFCLLYMCKYPEMQEKVYREIESQIGLFSVGFIISVRSWGEFGI